MSSSSNDNASRARAGIAAVRDSLRGEAVDPVRGPVGRTIVMLAVPMVLEMVLESVFAVVDIFFVSRLGADAVAAVGLTESLMVLIYTAAIGLSIGVTATVARRIGEGDADGAATATVQAIVLCAFISAIVAIAGSLNAHALLRLMGASDEVVRVGGGYASVMLAGNAAILLLFLLNAAFRGAGDARIAMRVLWFANSINLVLDPCLIFGLGPFPELGVTGAAVATTIGRGAAVLVQIATLLRGSGRLRVRARHVGIRPAVMARLVRLSSTGTLQVFIGEASWIGLVRLLSGFGSEAVAGYTITFRIVLFALMPAWGLSNAAATMVGQALGARMPDRAERSVAIAGVMNVAFCGIAGLLFLLAAPWIVSLFGADAATAEYAVRGLRIMSAGFCFYAYGMVLTQSFNGAGDAWTPTMLNLVCFWLWEIPLAWLLAVRAGLGPDGIFTAVAIAFCTLTVASAALFRRGRWKLVEV
jgi:putative MATE family efflux protein